MLYDVIVVGAGPSGSLAARTCAQSGLEVLLLDKTKFPRVKPCGGIVSVRSMRVLHRAGIKLSSKLIERKILGVELIGPDQQAFTLWSRKLLACTVLRNRFDYFLTKQAIAAGTQFIENHRLIGLEHRKDVVICHTNQGTFEGHVIIGADGVASRVSRITGLRGLLSSEASGIAVEADVPIPSDVFKENLNPTRITLSFPWIPLGYAWVFPRRHSISLGLGGLASEIRKLPYLLQLFARRISKAKGFKVPTIQNIRGHPLPAYGFHYPLVADKVILVGDAAGFVDVFTGQGICYALESGILAGQIAVEAVKRGIYNIAVLQKYQELVLRRFGEELRYSLKVARFIHRHLYGGFRLIRRFQGVTNFITELARGEIDYYGLIRNPLRLLKILVVGELQSRLMTKPR